MEYAQPVDLAELVHPHLGVDEVSPKLLTELIGLCLASSMAKEEGEAVRCCLTYVRDTPLEEAPAPRLTLLADPIVLNVEALAKLSKAVDPWAGAIAIRAKDAAIEIVGLIDQRVAKNRFLIREIEHNPPTPGLFSIAIEGDACVAVYSGDRCLGKLSGFKLSNDLPICEAHAIGDIVNSLSETFAASNQLNPRESAARFFRDALYRIVIGLRQYGSGGILLVLDIPVTDLSVKYGVKYRGVRDAVEQLSKCLCEIAETTDIEAAKSLYVSLSALRLQLTAALRFVSSLGRVDGAIVMNSDLEVLGFGAILQAGAAPENILVAKNSQDAIVQVEALGTAYGTRHQAAEAYVAKHPSSVAFVVSEDGPIRISCANGQVTVWDQLSLLDVS